ncbi:class I SAM-dependent methyltransferase [Candidatus Woesearchaeota archaeon]|nr:class I SAM-dependent methyltransferase [Candidatus Woesearchaeota archaeon]
MEKPPIPDPEAQFLEGLVELQYGLDVEKKLRSLSLNVSWAVGWPEKNTAFWNAEAFLWRTKIDGSTRAFITQKLSFLHGKKNLDLGCGSCSYLSSVGLDVSPKMLAFNDECYEKVQGDLENPLPFSDQSFGSTTAVFVLNYVSHLDSLIKEVWRVLELGGTFVVVLSARPINDWQRQKQVWTKSKQEWCEDLGKVFSSVLVEEQQGLLFFTCVK